jgi:trehalose 6-phosphate phosphatase
MSSPSAASLLPPPPPLDGDRHSVLLDFDGTLVDLADRPDAVIVDEALGALLRALVGTFAGRVALVSGRSVAQIEHFLGGAVPGIAVVGSHGAELRLGDRCITPDRPQALIEAERALTEAFGTHEGVVIEVKSYGVAAHYRLAPAQEAEARRIAAAFVGVDGLVLQEGKMMVELRIGGCDKGSGIAALLEHAPFAGHVPVFAGDDVTDEAGLAIVTARGGIGVLVGAERPSAAGYRLDDVAAVRRWLGAAA